MKKYEIKTDEDGVFRKVHIESEENFRQVLKNCYNAVQNMKNVEIKEFSIKLMKR